MLSWLILLAFSEKDSTDTAADSLDLLTALEHHLSGDLDSSQQAQEDSAYGDVSLKSCLLRVESIESPTLYIEQALSDKQHQPYRRRSYILNQIDGRTVSSEVYEPDSPDSFIEVCSQAETRTVSVDSVTMKFEYEVVLEWSCNEFIGETGVNTCKGDMNGAAYATSIVETTGTMISYRDQGWNSSDQRVWGVVDGPYVFLRK